MKIPYHLLKEGFETLVIQQHRYCPHLSAVPHKSFYKRCTPECIKEHSKDKFEEKAWSCWIDWYVELAKQSRRFRFHFLKKGELDLSKEPPCKQ